MKKEQEDRLIYEKPEVEIIEFQLEDSIATSGDFGPDTPCSEMIF
ncbi:MAG: hypothetical protein WC479_03215 [Candidatus Izemoplasmatales bacterium]|nr:hypothetical protein [Candidatus Izemoplasmatales bacterium]